MISLSGFHYISIDCPGCQVDYLGFCFPWHRRPCERPWWHRGRGSSSSLPSASSANDSGSCLPHHRCCCCCCYYCCCCCCGNPRKPWWIIVLWKFTIHSIIWNEIENVFRKRLNLNQGRKEIEFWENFNWMKKLFDSTFQESSDFKVHYRKQKFVLKCSLAITIWFRFCCTLLLNYVRVSFRVVVYNCLGFLFRVTELKSSVYVYVPQISNPIVS